MAITSHIRKPLSPAEAVVKDWQSAGLLKPSVFKPVIATIEKEMILKKLGIITQKDRENLIGILHTILETN